MSFGGSEIRKNVIIDISAQGAEIADDIAVRMEQVARNIEGVNAMFRDGSIDGAQYVGMVAGLQKELNALGGTYVAVGGNVNALSDSVTRNSTILRGSIDANQAATKANQDHADAINKLVAAGQFQATVQAKLNQALIEGAWDEGIAERAVIKTTAAVDKGAKAKRSYGEEADKSTSATRALYYGVQLLEDSMYGFQAIVNNIPLVVNEVTRAFGASRDTALKWAAGLSFAAIGIELALPAIRKLWDALGAEGAASSRTNLENIENQLKRLKETTWFIHVDKSQIEDLELRLKKAKALQDEFNRAATGQTEVEQEAAKRARHAIVEQAGGGDETSGVENLRNAMMAFREAQPGRFADNKTFQGILAGRREVADLDAKIRKGGVSFDELKGMTEFRERVANRVNDMEFKLRKETENAVAMALQGRAKGVDTVGRFVAADPAFFARRGIGPGFAQEIGEAGRDQVQKDLAVGNETPFEARRNLGKRNIERLLKDRMEAEKAQIEVARAGRKEDEAEADAEVQKLNDANIAFIKAKKEKERLKKLAKGQEKLDQTQHEQDVAAVAAPFKQALAPNLEGRIASNIARGVPTDQIIAGLTPQVTNTLRRNQGGPLSDEAAAEIVSEVMAKVDAKIAATGLGRQEGAAQVFGGIAEKGRRAARADARRPMAEARQDQAEMLRGRQGMQQQGIARDFQNYDPSMNNQQALSAAHRTMQLMNKGIDYSRATLQAYSELAGQVIRANQAIQGLQGQLQQVRGQVQQAAGRHNMQRPTFLPHR